MKNMKEQLYVKTQSFIFAHMELLRRTYPELDTVINWNSLYKNVQNRLRQFNMAKNYKSDEIIMEVLTRYDKKVKKKEEIPNVEAWMKLTALNCIRELNRQEYPVTAFKKIPHDPLDFETDPKLVKSMMSNGEDITDLESENMSQVRKAMSKLPSYKRELLELRIVRDLSWNEIANHYISKGKNVKVATLRKRKERALEELRGVFLEMIREDN